MSVGHLCEHCGQGRVRPFQFSLDQAIVTCDNVECDSRLEISPWDCIVDRNLRLLPPQTPDSGHLPLWSRSSSSSGIHSDLRSPLFSPAQSRESVTDREVEHFLRRSYAPKSRNTKRKNLPSECPKPGKGFSAFFELLDSLDLDSPNHPSIKKECPPMSQAGIDDAGLDAVTSELESWMKDFDTPMNTIKGETSENDADAQLNQMSDNVKATEEKTEISQRLYIPSKGSAFSQVSPKKDNVKRLHNCSSTENVHVNVVEKNGSYNSITPLEKSFDLARHDLSSICDAQFLSPAASAVSDDSGYEESANKGSLVLLPLSLSEKKRDPSSCTSLVPENKKKRESQSKTSLASSTVKELVDTKVSSIPPQCQLNVLPAVVSSELPSRSVAHPSDDNMDFQESNSLPQELSNPSCSKEHDDIGNGNTTEAISPKSSQPSTLSVPVSETENIISVSNESDLKSSCQDSVDDALHKVSVSKELNLKSSCQNSLKDVSHELAESNQSSNINDEGKNRLESCSNLKRAGRPKGRPRKPQHSGPSKYVAKRNKSQYSRVSTEKESNDTKNVASLRKGLATLLQAPTLHIKKDGNRHLNLTNLGLRSRLHGTLIQDPWSVPELFIEELCIEIVVEGSRTLTANLIKKGQPYPSQPLQAALSKSKSKVKKEYALLGDSIDVNKDSQTRVGDDKKVINADPDPGSLANATGSKFPDLASVNESPLHVDHSENVFVHDDDDDDDDERDSDTSGSDNSSDSSSNRSSRNNSNSNSSVSPCVENIDINLKISQDVISIKDVPTSVELKQQDRLKEFSIDFRSEKQTLKNYLDNRFLENSPSDECPKECSTLPCGVETAEKNNEVDSQCDRNYTRIDLEEGRKDKKIDLEEGKKDKKIDLEEGRNDKKIDLEEGRNDKKIDLEEGTKCERSKDGNSVYHSKNKVENVEEKNVVSKCDEIEKKLDGEESKNCENSKEACDAICGVINVTNVKETNVVSQSDEGPEEKDSQEIKDYELNSIFEDSTVRTGDCETTLDSELCKNQTTVDNSNGKEFLNCSVSALQKCDNVVGECIADGNIDMGVIASKMENVNLPEISLADISYELNSDRYLTKVDIPVKSENVSDISDRPPELGSHFLLGSINSKIRSWMGCREGLINELEVDDGHDADSDIDTECNSRKRINEESPSSKYFNTLLKDVNFEDEFFQCPTTENLSNTFDEHLSSSLFFGETAHNSVPVESQTRTSVVSPTTSLGLGSNLSVPTSSSSHSLSLLNTSVMREVSTTLSSHSSVSNSVPTLCSSTVSVNTILSQTNIPGSVAGTSAKVSTCASASKLPATLPEQSTLAFSHGSVVCTSLSTTSKTSTPVENMFIGGIASVTSVTQSLNTAIPSVSEATTSSSLKEDNFKSKRPTNCHYLHESHSKLNMKPISALDNSFNYQESIGRLPCSLSKVKFEPEVYRNLDNLSIMGEHSNINIKQEFVKVKQEPFSYNKNVTRPSYNDSDIPTISIDSDDEIQIVMPKKKSPSEKGKGILLPNIKVECDLDVQYPTTAPENAQQPVGLKIQKSEVVGHSNKRKIEAQCEVVKKKLKTCDASREEFKTVNRKFVPVDNKVCDNCSSDESECGDELMCGIMDNSVVHDSNCYSPRTKAFVEIDNNARSVMPPESLKFYFGSRKTNFKLCEDLKVTCENMSSEHEGNVNDITLKETNFISSDCASRAFSFNHDDKFGCTKSSPQYEGYTSAMSEESDAKSSGIGAKDLSFLCHETSSESCVSSPDDIDDDDSEYNGNMKVLTAMKKRLMNTLEPEISACESEELSLSTSGFDTGTSLYDGSGEESESDLEIGQRASKVRGNKLCTKIQITDSKGNTFKLPLAQVKQQNILRKAASASESKTELHSHGSTYESQSSPCFVPAVPLPKKLARSLYVPSVSHSQNSTSVQCLSKQPHVSGTSVYTKNIHGTSASKQVWIARKTDPQKVTAVKNPNISQEPKPVCLPGAQFDQKGSLQPRLLQNAASSSAHHHHLNHPPHHLNHPPPPPHFNPSVPTVCDPSTSHNVRKPLLCQSSLPSTKVSHLHSSHLLRAATSDSFIDCEMPSSANPNVIIPPALRTSYANCHAPLTHRDVTTHSQISNSELASNRPVNSLEEQIIAIKTETSNGPVMRLLRVNVVTNKPNEASPVSRVNVDSNKSSEVPLGRQKVGLSYPNKIPASINSESGGVPLSRQTLSVSDASKIPVSIKSEDVEKKKGPAEFSKVKIGSKGHFYIRPTSAMMRAISEMRKKKEEQNLLSDDSVERSSIQLPDGTPICNPMLIPRNRLIKHKLVDPARKKRKAKVKARKQRRKFRIKNFVKEKLQETVTRNKDEVPEMVVVCIGGKLHIYSREPENKFI